MGTQMHSHGSCFDFCCRTKKWLCHESEMWCVPGTEVHLYPFSALPSPFPSSDVRAAPAVPFPFSLTLSFSTISFFPVAKIYYVYVQNQFFLHWAGSMLVYLLLVFFNHLILRKLPVHRVRITLLPLPHSLLLLLPFQNNPLELFDELQPNLWEELYF